jgi:hypothetical protein
MALAKRSTACCSSIAIAGAAAIVICRDSNLQTFKAKIAIKLLNATQPAIVIRFTTLRNCCINASP